MDLHAFLLELVQSLRPGDTLVEGVTFTGASTELGPRLTFASPGGPVHVEVALRAHAQRWAVERGPWVLSYRAGRSDAPVSSIVGKQICEALAEHLPAGAAERPDMRRAPRVREVPVTRMLEWRELGPDAHYTLSPYAGCTIGCRYCYAQTRLSPARALMGLPQLPWGSYVDVRTDAPKVLARELTEMRPGPIKFCPIVSDPYQPLERTYRLTRTCLEVLADAPPGFTTMVLTRSADILEDAKLIASLPAARVGVSLPSADPDVLAHFEPRAADLQARLEVLRRFSALGVPTIAVVQPMLPGPVDVLADVLARYAASVSVGGLEGTNAGADLFEDPRYRGCAGEDWQRARLHELRAALQARAVPLWHGELPPDLRGEA